MKAKLTFCVFLIYITNLVNACKDDKGCEECNLYFFMIGFQYFGFYNCDKCKDNFTLDIQTHTCKCETGFYEAGSELCQICPPSCTSCSDMHTCLRCASQQGRVLVNGACECKEGYEAKSNAHPCTKKANKTLIISMVTVGSLLFIFLILVLYWILRKRN